MTNFFVTSRAEVSGNQREAKFPLCPPFLFLALVFLTHPHFIRYISGPTYFLRIVTRGLHDFLLHSIPFGHSNFIYNFFSILNLKFLNLNIRKKNFMFFFHVRARFFCESLRMRLFFIVPTFRTLLSSRKKSPETIYKIKILFLIFYKNELKNDKKSKENKFHVETFKFLSRKKDEKKLRYVIDLGWKIHRDIVKVATIGGPNTCEFPGAPLTAQESTESWKKEEKPTKPFQPPWSIFLFCFRPKKLHQTFKYTNCRQRPRSNRNFVTEIIPTHRTANKLQLPDHSRLEYRMESKRTFLIMKLKKKREKKCFFNRDSFVGTSGIIFRRFYRHTYEYVLFNSRLSGKRLARLSDVIVNLEYEPGEGKHV